MAVEEVYDTGEWEVVYNLRVADHHTYFVGDEGWGFSVWAHNSYKVETQTAKKYNYPKTGSYVKVIFDGTDGSYSKTWFQPKTFTDKNAIVAAARIDMNTGLGDQLAAEAQRLADGWKYKPLAVRYGDYEDAALRALAKVNGFLPADDQLTLDQIDAGSRFTDPTFANTAEGDAQKAAYTKAKTAFWNQRASAIGAYVDKGVKKTFENYRGLVPSASGPDFAYTKNGATVYFEVLPDSTGSLEDHADPERLVSQYLWRAVFYNRDAINGP